MKEVPEARAAGRRGSRPAAALRPDAHRAHRAGYRLATGSGLNDSAGVHGSRPARRDDGRRTRHAHLRHLGAALAVVLSTLAGLGSRGLAAESEAPLLTHVRQLTSPSMGFEKAGESYFSPDGKQVIFQAVPKGREHYQIYVINIDGTGLKMVSTGKGECTCGYFRPDGKGILFASSHLDPRLADATPAPSPKQGYQVKQRNYVWHFNEYMDIFAANLDGSDRRRLTTAKGYDAEGAYGPDGKLIAFTSNRSGDMELYTMHADGSNVRRLTHAKGYDGGPFISPDGKRIIFRADRRGDDHLQLFVMDVDGSNERQLTDNKAVNWAPYWHPTGRFAAFATSLNGHYNYEIYLIHVRSKALQRLTNKAGADVLPTFSTDGKRMLWTSKRGPDETSQVFVADFHVEHAFPKKP